MTRVDLKGINTIRRRLANGERRTYYYHRATGLRLEGKPGSVEFIESWQAAERAIKATDRHEGTFAAWINGYRASDDFTLLADATRKDYLKQIAKIEAEFSDMPLAAMRDPAVRAEFLDWRDRLAKRGARQADYAMTVLARVLAWAVNRGLLAVNPAARPGRRYRSARAEIIWQPADVEAFLAHASPDLALAMILARDTAQRQGDLLRLTWSAYDGERITLKQSKRGASVSVPVTAALKRLLDAAPRRAVTILTAAEGLPWKADHFRHQWRAATLKAGLDGLRFNDLRGTCVTALADAGCTPAQIAAVTGHSQRSVHAILDTYQARTATQASAAIIKLERHLRSEAAKRLQNGKKSA
jgi:integrase